MFAVYSSLKGTVWGTYEKVRDAVERSVVVTVPEQEKGRLLADIEAFDRLLRKADDPYPAMGAFVNQGRQVLADGVVDGDEVRALSSFLEGEIGDARD